MISASGRWFYLSADPIGLDGGMNLYAYVNGNPVNAKDFAGLMGVRPDDAIPPVAERLGEVLAVDCIAKGCKQGNPKSYLRAWADCSAAYTRFLKNHPQMTPEQLAFIIQLEGGQDAFMDACAKKCEKETKDCC